MKPLRICISCAIVLIGVFVLCFGMISSFGPTVPNTVKNSREIEESFKAASSYVLSFKEQHGHIPTQQQFDTWAKTFSIPSPGTKSPDGMWIMSSGFPDEAVELFGKPPKDSFLLMKWRGEWMEYYASWVNRTSLQFDESKYFFLGNKYAQALLFTLFAFLIFAGGYWFWPRQAPNTASSSNY